jgi:(aminoalkyl)phosphonate N-acetyltransferase
MNITIRRATEADAEVIYRFVCELEEMIFDPAIFFKCYMYNIGNPKNIYLVAETEEEVIGYISCHGQLLLHHMNWVYEIQEAYVDKAYRNKGIGKVLLQQLEAALSNEQYDTVEVTSNIKRTEAHEFYKNNGYHHTHFKFTKRK